MAGRDILDQPSSYRDVDPAGAGALIRDLPEQLEEGLRIGEGAPTGGAFRGVTVFGMGGSGVVGRVLAAYLAPRAPVPVVVVRDFAVPAWVGPGVLAVLVSYSGNTLETLTAAREVVRRRVAGVAVTSGGALRTLAADAGYPWLPIPAGRPPRCSLGFMAGALMSHLARAGLFQFPDVGEVAGHLRERAASWGFDVPTASNGAKQLAVALEGAGMAAIYGAGPLAAVAAERFRAQLAENAKFYAAGHAFPELCHNELVAFERPTDVARRFPVVVFRPPWEKAEAAKQVDAALELIAPAVASITQVRPRAEKDLPALFELIYFGDLVSYYLSLLRGVDPTPVRNVVALKERLAA